MRSDPSGPHGGSRTDGLRRRPGSRPDRLAEAEKQLAIALEGVDLDAEPALARALTDAVIAVDRATELADEADGTQPGAGSASRADSAPGAWERLVEDVDEGRQTTSEGTREEPTIESGGLRFVGEAGAE